MSDKVLISDTSYISLTIAGSQNKLCKFGDEFWFKKIYAVRTLNVCPIFWLLKRLLTKYSKYTNGFLVVNRDIFYIDFT